MLLSASDVIAVACAKTRLETNCGKGTALTTLKELCVKGISAAPCRFGSSNEGGLDTDDERMALSGRLKMFARQKFPLLTLIK